MNMLTNALESHKNVDHYKINTHKKESYELFFVKGKLETVRCTDTCDTAITVYREHGGFTGDAEFPVYPSTTEAQLEELIEDAAAKALLIENPHYDLPGAESGEYQVESSLSQGAPADIAARIANIVFESNTHADGSLNSVEVFLNRHIETVENSLGLQKTQTCYDCMVEAIPTYNGREQSVELYEQYNFGSLDSEALRREISEKMDEVQARYEATVPASIPACPVVLCRLELAELFQNISANLNYVGVYSHSNIFSKGDLLQSDPQGDRITLTMSGQVPGSVASSRFDRDGLSLGEITLVENGRVNAYYGSNRFGQYLGETPTGELSCIRVEAGSAGPEDLQKAPYLEVRSMSGLQVDFYNDYIGGEIRLAYYHDGSSITPVTGISITGKLRAVLNHLRLSRETCVSDNYAGPAKAILGSMHIF